MYIESEQKKKWNILGAKTKKISVEIQLKEEIIFLISFCGSIRSS